MIRSVLPRSTIPDQSSPGAMIRSSRIWLAAMLGSVLSCSVIVSPDVALQELPRALGTRLREEFIRRRGFDDPAAVHEQHRIGGFVREAHLVRHDDHGHAFGR